MQRAASFTQSPQSQPLLPETIACMWQLWNERQTRHDKNIHQSIYTRTIVLRSTPTHLPDFRAGICQPKPSSHQLHIQREYKLSCHKQSNWKTLSSLGPSASRNNTRRNSECERFATFPFQVLSFQLQETEFHANITPSWVRTSFLTESSRISPIRISK